MARRLVDFRSGHPCLSIEFEFRPRYMAEVDSQRRARVCSRAPCAVGLRGGLDMSIDIARLGKAEEASTVMDNTLQNRDTLTE